jgi:hypothetical protein
MKMLKITELKQEGREIVAEIKFLGEGKIICRQNN